MTDITSQDRRAARAWAKNWQGDLDADTSAAARVILATVDAPAPTLAEAVEAWADKHYTGVVGTGKHELLALAARAAQMEHDLAEARDDANALYEELAGAESEVERLTAERDRLESAQHLSDGSAWGGPVREPTAQKGAESNAESIDPADVPPGEAWLVECRGERRHALKDNDIDIPWNTIDADGGYLYENNEDITLVSRLVPAPRVITDPDELERLAEGSIVRDRAGHAWERYPDEDWYSTEELDDGFSSRRLADYAGPVTVLWEPAI